MEMGADKFLQNDQKMFYAPLPYLSR